MADPEVEKQNAVKRKLVSESVVMKKSDASCLRNESILAVPASSTSSPQSTSAALSSASAGSPTCQPQKAQTGIRVQGISRATTTTKPTVVTSLTKVDLSHDDNAALGDEQKKNAMADPEVEKQNAVKRKLVSESVVMKKSKGLKHEQDDAMSDDDIVGKKKIKWNDAMKDNGIQEDELIREVRKRNGVGEEVESDGKDMEEVKAKLAAQKRKYMGNTSEKAAGKETQPANKKNKNANEG